jgi:hypothetical protein
LIGDWLVLVKLVQHGTETETGNDCSPRPGHGAGHHGGIDERAVTTSQSQEHAEGCAEEETCAATANTQMARNRDHPIAKLPD